MSRRHQYADSVQPSEIVGHVEAADPGARGPIIAARGSLRASRWLGRTPRIAAVCLVASLCAAGVRASLDPRRTAVARQPVARTVQADLPAEAFAQAFARSYLTWSPNTSDRHEAAVARFAPNSLDAGAGLRPPSRGSQTVRWTVITGDSVRGSTRLITVLVGTSGGDLTLAVPVQRDARGLLSVAAYPALVGPPPANPRAATSHEAPVDDAQLVVAAKRAVTNYLPRSPRNSRRI